MNDRNIYEKINEIDNLADLENIENDDVEVSEEEKNNIMELYNRHSSHKKNRGLKIAAAVAAVALCLSVFAVSDKNIRAELENSVKSLFGIDVSDEYVGRGNEKYEKIGEINGIGDVLAKSGEVFIDNNMIYSTAYISLPYVEKKLYYIEPHISIEDKNGEEIVLGTSGTGVSFKGNTDNGRQVFAVTLEADGMDRRQDVDSNKLLQNISLDVGVIDKDEIRKMTDSILDSNSEDEINRINENLDAELQKNLHAVNPEKKFSVEAPIKNLKKESKYLADSVKTYYENSLFTISNMSINRVDMQLKLTVDTKNTDAGTGDIDVVVENYNGENLLLDKKSGSGNDEHFFNQVFDYRFNSNTEQYRKFFDSKNLKIKVYRNSEEDEANENIVERLKESTKVLAEMINKNNALYNIDVDKNYNEKVYSQVKNRKLMFETEVSLKK